MASTINSTGTSSGLATAADASGVLELQGGGNTGITIDATGGVTLADSAGVPLTVADLAALKALTTRPESVVVKTGQAAGTWQWVAGSTSTADDYTVVECTSGTAGRYKKIGLVLLTANTTFYVRTDGSDSNTGRANTAAGAFLTLQGAINYLKRTVSFAGYQVTLQLAAGTYAGFTLNGGFVGENSTSLFKIVGSTATPSSVVVQGTSSNCIRIFTAAVALSGFTIQTTTNGVGLYAGAIAYIEHDNLRFGSCVEEMMLVNAGSVVVATGPTTVAGNASAFLHATNNSRVSFETQTVTFSGTPAFSTYVLGLNQSSVSFASGTLVGDKTGGSTIHIDSTVNLSSTTGKIWGTGAPITIEAGGNVIYNPAQDIIYVRSDGSDNNDGFTNTAAGAFLTVAAAITWLKKRPYDAANSRAPTIQVGAGTWTTSIALANIPNVDYVVLLGDTTTPANVVLSTTSADCVTANNIGTLWYVRGFRMTTTTSGYCMRIQRNSHVIFNAIEFSTCVGAHVSATLGAFVETGGNYSIIGGAAQHIFLDTSGRAQIDTTVTLTGTPAFSGHFARLESGSMGALRPTWSGAATGTRYYLSGNSVINANGAGTSSLPGNVAGTTVTGGQYI